MLRRRNAGGSVKRIGVIEPVPAESRNAKLNLAAIDSGNVHAAKPLRPPHRVARAIGMTQARKKSAAFVRAAMSDFFAQLGLRFENSVTRIVVRLYGAC